jgi:hypothetical protein
MNRQFRRLAAFGKRWSERRSGAAMTPKESQAPDPRAKTSGHGKKTADKWNQ